MQLVLDTPMGADDVQQPLGGNVFGKQEVAHNWRLGAATMGASARGDAGQCNNAGEPVCGSEVGIAHSDGGTPAIRGDL